MEEEEGGGGGGGYLIFTVLERFAPLREVQSRTFRISFQTPLPYSNSTPHS